MSKNFVSRVIARKKKKPLFPIGPETYCTSGGIAAKQSLTGALWPQWRNFYMDIHEPPCPGSVEQLARQVFTDFHQTIIFHESGSLAGDVGSVHDMRVAVRRLRVALSNFAVCASKEVRKRLRSSLENLADALGGVRDMDVMIAAMKTSKTPRTDQEKSAISAMISRLQARRRSRLRGLMNYLSGEDYANFKRESPSDWIKIEGAKPHSDPADVQFKTARRVEAPEVEVIEEEHGQAA